MGRPAKRFILSLGLSAKWYFHTDYNKFYQYLRYECALCPGFGFLKEKRNPTDKLCDWNSGYGALQCNYHNTGCKGAIADDCYPNFVWSGTASGSSHYNRNLNSGTFNENSNGVTYAFGVRCVLDLDFLKRKRFQG